MTFFATGTSGTIGRYLPESITAIDLDLKSESTEFDKIPFSAEDVVIHLAAIVGVNLVNESISCAHEINVIGTQKLGMAAAKKNIKKFIFLSTSHVYEPSSSPIKETGKIKPASAYAIQKHEGEKILKSIFQDDPNKLCILRIFSLLDWGMPTFSLGGAIEKLISKDSKSILKNGDDVRDFLTPRQVAEIIVAISMMENSNGVINVCSGTSRTIRSAAMKMLYLHDQEQISHKIQNGFSHSPKIIGDNSKLKFLLPKFDFNWNPNPGYLNSAEQFYE